MTKNRYYQLNTPEGDSVEIERAGTLRVAFYVVVKDLYGEEYTVKKPIDKEPLIKWLDEKYEPRKYGSGRMFMKMLENAK